MVTLILKTKLYIPPTRPELVPRPRLIERLNAGLHHKLTLISAPAGFGKTTLLSEWVNESKRPVAWLSLDDDDNDLQRFFTYLIAALQSINGKVGESVLAALHSPQPPPSETVLTILINDIVGSSVDFTMVLDDYSLIESRSVHDAVAFLIDHLPPQLHLTIVARSDPPLPLSRLRARAQMSELREDDLRFTRDEATTFLNAVMGLNVSPEDIEALENRTEGWIAGLQLAAVSMQRHKDATGFIREFTGGHRYIVDYLGEEVLRQQDERVQSFLCETSILRRLSAPLCDAVIGRGRSQDLLEQLVLQRDFDLVYHAGPRSKTIFPRGQHETDYRNSARDESDTTRH